MRRAYSGEREEVAVRPVAAREEPPREPRLEAEARVGQDGAGGLPKGRQGVAQGHVADRGIRPHRCLQRTCLDAAAVPGEPHHDLGGRDPVAQHHGQPTGSRSGRSRASGRASSELPTAIR